MPDLYSVGGNSTSDGELDHFSIAKGLVRQILESKGIAYVEKAPRRSAILIMSLLVQDTPHDPEDGTADRFLAAKSAITEIFAASATLRGKAAPSKKEAAAAIIEEKLAELEEL